MATKPRGRPKKHARYDDLVQSLPRPMKKRPKYVDGIGVFRGAGGDTAWIKIRLTKGGIYRGRSHPIGSSLEIKMGKLSSWSWENLETEQRTYQGKADRGEALEESPDLLFSEWADDWLERAKRRLKGHETPAVHIRTHLKPEFGNKSLRAIRVQDINSWISRRLDQAKPATAKRELDTLNAILNSAVSAGHIPSNPGERADKIRGIAGRQRFLVGDELKSLLVKAAETADWLPDFILWCLHSGMRRGEVLALAHSDIRRFDDGNVVALVRNPKNDQPRFIPCTGTMIEILERQKGRRIEGDDRVFPVARMTLRRKWETARKASGLDDVTMHDLRRTHGTHAAAAGVDLRTLAGRMGHANLSMLQRHYAALVGSAEQEAAETIQGVFDRMSASKP